MSAKCAGPEGKLRRIILALFTSLMLAGFPAASQAAWHEGRTKHFIIYADYIERIGAGDGKGALAASRGGSTSAPSSGAKN